MPSARTNGPVQVRQHERVQRTDSVKSERSDKRVSFNNDVGVKHIPRGQKNPNKTKFLVSNNNDEWASCSPVRREPPPREINEKEKEASDLVRLLDNVACSTGSQSDTPSKYNSKSLDRLVYKNNKNNKHENINNNRKNIVGSVNNISETGTKTYPVARTANPINKSKLGSSPNPPLGNSRHPYIIDNRRVIRRSLSPPPTTSDNSDTDSYDQNLRGFKSVPDLSSTLYYDNKDAYQYYFQDFMNNPDSPKPPSKSIDNLLVGNTPSLLYKEISNSPANTYKSADNLIEVSRYQEYPFPGFKSIDNLLSPTYSNIEAIRKHNMSNNQYKPRVGNMINKFNGDSDNLRVRSHIQDTAGGLTEPSHLRHHNHNQPFSYIDPPLSSVQEIRKITPPRETRPLEVMYAQVNKNERSGNRKNNDNHEYSAKIIITDEREKNIHRINEDDAYETYEVQDNKLKKVGTGYESRKHQDFGLSYSSGDLTGNYNDLSYNNINMSSIGVQTDALPKPPNRNKKISRHSNSTNSPTRGEQNGKKYVDNDLVSSSLVRQINHGFGRTDRSPSPPLRSRNLKSTPKAIVPLLSDTSDSEADYRIRSDPLAKIRDQVMVRERLQEDKEAEELAERDYHESRREILSYNPDEMRPLTIDEVDALTLEVDETGRKSLIVANNTSNRNVSKTIQTTTDHMKRERSNSSSRNNTSAKTNFDSLKRDKSSTLSRNPSQTVNSINNDTLKKEKNSRLDKTQKEKPSMFRVASPSRLFSTLDRNRKNNVEKEKKENKSKDKKKKRIKIKFFYDPRPQDNHNVDPLSRFTEYKGTSSDEKSSPRNNRINTSTIDRKQRMESSRSRSRENLEPYRSSRDVRDGPRESRNPHDRYDRSHSRERSREFSKERTPRREMHEDKGREPRGRTYSERSSNNGLHDNRRDHYKSQEISKRSLDRRSEKSIDRRGENSIDRRGDRYNTRYNERSVDRREIRNGDLKGGRSLERSNSKSRERLGERSIDRQNQRNNDIKRERSRRDDYGRRNTEERKVYRSEDSKVERRYSDDRTDNESSKITEEYDPRGSPDGRPSRALSDKYRSATLYEPDQERPASPLDKVETLSQQERVMRQRNKFLSSFITDGRAKSSPNLKITNVISGTKSVPSDREDALLSSRSTKSSVSLQNKNNLSTEKLKKNIPKVTIEPPESPSIPKKKNIQNKKKKRWPWSFLGLRGSTGKKTQRGSSPGGLYPPRASSRASSRASKASSRSSVTGSHRPRRPSVRAAKIRRDVPDGRTWQTKDRLPPPREPNWESVTLNRSEYRARKQDEYTRDRSKYGSSQKIDIVNGRKSSAESSDSFKSPSRGKPVVRNNSYKQRYFGESDVDARQTRVNIINGDYRSLPNRPSRVTINRQNSQKKFGRGGRRISPTAGGSAGSSLQSSESEADSRQGSHASKASKASHVSTESNRSVYLHATAVADIPVHRDSEDAPSERQASIQSKRVSRSFSLVAPWKPRHYRDKVDVEYDNGRENRRGRSALPPRPPRRPIPEYDSKKVSRSQSVYKDSKLAGWLRRRRNKEAKGI